MPSGLVRVVLPVLPLLAAFAVSPVTDTLTITGTVKSEQGMNLVGANVYITEMNVSVGTNDAGVYRIVLARERVRGQSVHLRVRAIGPTWSRLQESGVTPSRGILPYVGLSPTVPQSEEGMRIEPPVSVPMEPKPTPLARATAEPPLDPPLILARSHGLRAAP